MIIAEAAKLARVSKVTIRRRIRAGALAAELVDGRYQIDATELARVFELEAPASPPPPPPSPDVEVITGDEWQGRSDRSIDVVTKLADTVTDLHHQLSEQRKLLTAGSGRETELREQVAALAAKLEAEQDRRHQAEQELDRERHRTWWQRLRGKHLAE